MQLCVVFYRFTDIDNHGGRQGNMELALARWQNLVALHEATDALHRAMRIALYCPSSMVIKIIVNLATFFYIVDNKMINYSFMFTI
jgi:hypothetical protein